ncbi:MAG: pilus assembly protein [Rickettsiales bacterium]|nr:pilus assembly protein [Rickettsiales bacterium]
MPVLQSTSRKPRVRTSFWREQDGVSALEFALIAPVFLFLLSGIIEFSLIMLTNTVMESAAHATSRLGKTGFDPSGMTREQAILNSITSRTASLLDPERIVMTSTIYPDFSSVGRAEPCINPVNPPCGGAPGVNYSDVNGNGTWDSDMGAAGLGDDGDVVVYSVTYPWPIMSPLMQPIFGSIYNITVRSVVRNEPFNAAVGGR